MQCTVKCMTVYPTAVKLLKWRFEKRRNVNVYALRKTIMQSDPIDDIWITTISNA